VSTVGLWFSFFFYGCEADQVQARTADYALAKGLPIPVQAYSAGEIFSTLGLFTCGVIIGLCIMAIRHMWKDWKRSEKLKKLAIWENN